MKYLACAAVLAMAWAGPTSCDKYNYTEKLQGLGKRVEILEQMVLQTNKDIVSLNTLIATIESHGYVTKVEHNADGTYTIHFNNGDSITLRDGQDGADGSDGHDATLDISVAQDPVTGRWYWTLNGQWLLDPDGNRMQAGATDGRDGRDGRNEAIVPMVRINPDTRHWEYSNDGGLTWIDTGQPADGKDGKDGPDDMFLEIKLSDDGKTVTFILANGKSYTVAVDPDH